MNPLSLAFMVTGCVFFLAGTVGLLRFPDVVTRLHALTKADNVGLGFLLVGLALESGSPLAAAKLLLAWGLVLLASASVSHLVASTALQRGLPPWRR
jgi:multicomponent Na+:H+ antiporter subunit G